MAEEEVGKVKHFFNKINVTVIELSNNLKTGDKIKIKGATTNFEQEIDSIQIEHEKIEEAKAGDSIGLKVKEPTREGDKVFRLTE